MGKQTKYTKSAQGKDCTVRIPYVCNGNPETVILAHLNGAGMAMKSSDIHGAYACSDCHTYLDSGYIAEGDSRDDRDFNHMLAIIETQKIMIADGVLKL